MQFFIYLLVVGFVLFVCLLGFYFFFFFFFYFFYYFFLVRLGVVVSFGFGFWHFGGRLFVCFVLLVSFFFFPFFKGCLFFSLSCMKFSSALSVFFMFCLFVVFRLFFLFLFLLFWFCILFPFFFFFFLFLPSFFVFVFVLLQFYFIFFVFFLLFVIGFFFFFNLSLSLPLFLPFPIYCLSILFLFLFFLCSFVCLLFYFILFFLSWFRFVFFLHGPESAYKNGTGKTFTHTSIPIHPCTLLKQTKSKTLNSPNMTPSFSWRRSGSLAPVPQDCSTSAALSPRQYWQKTFVDVFNKYSNITRQPYPRYLHNTRFLPGFSSSPGWLLVTRTRGAWWSRYRGHCRSGPRHFSPRSRVCAQEWHCQDSHWHFHSHPPLHTPKINEEQNPQLTKHDAFV